MTEEEKEQYIHNIQQLEKEKKMESDRCYPQRIKRNGCCGTNGNIGT